MNQNVTDFGMIKTALKEKARQMVFAQIVGISQPAVSEHLNKLTQAMGILAMPCISGF